MEPRRQDAKPNPQAEDGSPYEDLRTVRISNASHNTEPYGYQWPASRLSRYEMSKLTVAANKLKRPLNQLLKEAVDFYADKLLDELGIEIEKVDPNGN